MNALIANLLATSGEGETATDTEEQDSLDGVEATTTLGRLVTEDELVDCLVEAIRNGQANDEQLDVLRTALTGDHPTPLRVKVDHLRSKVDDLEAYSDALEEFIAEDGTAEEILDEVRTELKETDAELSDLSDRVDSIEAELATAREERSAIEEKVDAVDEDVQDLDGRHSREITGVDAKVDRLETAIESEREVIRDDIDELQARIDGMDALRESVNAIESDVEDLESVHREVRELEESVEKLEALEEDVREINQLSDRVEDLEGIPDDLKSLRYELEELNEFRSKFVDVVTLESASSADD